MSASARPVAVLFARADSIYKALPSADVWDEARDARLWPGGAPVVAHPPCRGWGKLRRFARPLPGELGLGPWAVEQVRKHGGVLEHPAHSTLWSAAGLPPPGQADAWGGWTLPILQHWWGHRAAKATWLYVVGCAPAAIPPIPLVLGRAGHVCCGTRMRRGSQGWRPEITKAEREHTPRALAEWLLDLARRTQMEEPQ